MGKLKAMSDQIASIAVTPSRPDASKPTVIEMVVGEETVHVNAANLSKLLMPMVNLSAGTTYTVLVPIEPAPVAAPASTASAATGAPLA